jgi:hypothetical protein
MHWCGGSGTQGVHAAFAEDTLLAARGSRGSRGRGGAHQSLVLVLDSHAAGSWSFGIPKDFFKTPRPSGFATCVPTVPRGVYPVLPPLGPCPPAIAMHPCCPPQEDLARPRLKPSTSPLPASQQQQFLSLRFLPPFCIPPSARERLAQWQQPEQRPACHPPCPRFLRRTAAPSYGPVAWSWGRPVGGPPLPAAPPLCVCRGF